MKSIRLHAFVVAIFLFSASAAGHFARPTIHLANQHESIKLEQIFPSRFGSWRIDDSQPVGIVSPDVKALLDKLYAQTLSRTYINEAGVRIMLSVAYGGDQSDATRAHRPDVCYPSQGFDIVSAGVSQVAMPTGNLPVRRMVAKLGARIEPVTFWFAVGEFTAVSGWDQKLLQLRYGLHGVIPDGMLVRVSSINADEQTAYANQANFIAGLNRAMPQTAVKRVFGSQLSS